MNLKFCIQTQNLKIGLLMYCINDTNMTTVRHHGFLKIQFLMADVRNSVQKNTKTNTTNGLR